MGDRCLSWVLHGLGCIWAPVVCFLFGFCILGMPKILSSNHYSWTEVKLKHELALRGTTTEGKKKDLCERWALTTKSFHVLFRPSIPSRHVPYIMSHSIPSVLLFTLVLFCSVRSSCPVCLVPSHIPSHAGLNRCISWPGQPVFKMGWHEAKYGAAKGK